MWCKLDASLLVIAIVCTVAKAATPMEKAILAVLTRAVKNKKIESDVAPIPGPFPSRILAFVSA
jgi:hypothetical protein